MTQQKGFTLIELVIVVVILGLLAATAMPRFINVTKDARQANLKGLAGGLSSAASLARAQYIVTGSNAATTVSMEGTNNITVLAESANAGLGGIPIADTGGIVAAAQINTTNDYDATGGGAAAGDTLTFQPKNGGSPTCQVTYTPNGNPRVVITDTGC